MFKNSLKKIIIAIIIVIVLVGLAGGGLWYRHNKSKNEPANIDVFTLLDDKDKLVYFEDVKLDPEVKQQFREKVAEIKADLTKATDNDTMVADYNNLGLYNSYLGDYQAAYDAYLNSLNTIKDSRMTLLAFGELLVKMKAYNSAEAVFNKTNELNPWEAKGYIKLANLYEVAGEPDKIEQTYQTGLSETLKNVDQNEYAMLLNDYAVWLVSQKAYDQAIVIYQQLAARQPQNKAVIDKKIADLTDAKGGTSK